MSHGITEKDSLAYAGQTPWHGLGNHVADDLTSAEMLVAAGLTWRLGVRPLEFMTADGARRPVGHQALVREDTLDVLDVVGPKYVPAQNDEVLAFFNDYLATGSMRLDTAGSLWGGRYVWGLAKLKEGFELAGGDAVTGHLLVANANKYGKGLIVKLVQTRVVCWNTLTVGLAERGNERVVIAHNRVFDDTARADALTRLGLAVDAFSALKKEAQVFSKAHLTDQQVDEVLASTYRLRLNDDGALLYQTRRAKRVKALYQGQALGADLPSAEGTAWGLLNAVTQHTDHEYGRDQDNRLRNSWFGGGEAIKRRARQALWKAVGA